MCEPKIAAENCGAHGYATPIEAAKELMELDELALSVAYPDDEVLAKGEKFINLSDKTNKLLDDLWIEVSVTRLSTTFWIVIAFAVVAVGGGSVIGINQKKKRAAMRDTE